MDAIADFIADVLTELVPRAWRRLRARRRARRLPVSRYREADRSKGRYKPQRYNVRVHSNLADMTLPPELRGRRKKVKVVGRAEPAQMKHGRGRKADKHRRDMARKQPRPRRKN